MKTQIAGLVLASAFGFAACGGGSSGGTSGGSASGSASAGSSTGAGASTGTTGHAAGSSTSGTGSTGHATSGASSSSTGTTGSHTTGGSTGASATTGGSGSTGGGACPAGATPCVPENPCDLGCSQGAGCVDQNAANFAQTGVTCDAGAVCEGQLCMQGSGPQMPNYDGGVLAAPNVVFMTYAVDPNQAALESWATWYMTGGYLPETVGQYGVGNGTADLVSLPDAVASLPDQYSIQQYITNEMATNPNVPPYSPNNVYMLMLPYAWADTGSFCQSQGGYHSVTQDNAGDNVVYGVVADCGPGNATDTIYDEVALSHEIVESSTDPLIGSWAFLSGDDAWSYIGGEIGDMCESLSTFYESDAGQWAQLFWSNEAAAASQPPCQPWPAGQAYITVLGDSTLVPAAPGTTVNIPVTGWASAPTQPWGIGIQDLGLSFSSSPTLDAGTIGPGQQVMAQFSVPAAVTGQPALGGGAAAAYIATQSGNNFGGWLLIGVVATCQTTADCSDETTACELDDAGVGSCVPNLCAPDAGAFSICSAAGKNDGVCLPSGFGSGPSSAVEVCNQAGSIAEGDGGCQPGRLVGGGASDYCAPTAGCVSGQTTSVCAPFCTSPDGGLQGNCPTGQDCISFTSQYYGNCQVDCSTTNTCPANQTCYPLGGGVSACFPN
jgi:hypothetical protein